MAPAAEPVSRNAPGLTGRPILSQRWRDVSFLHWRVDGARVKPLLPAGTVPDEFDGTSWVGLIAFRLTDFAILPGPALPYVGSFPEINVRLYSVDERGRRGVVFRSLEASRLLTVLAANASLGVPYRWARMSMSVGATNEYRSRRVTPSHPSTSIVTRSSQEAVESDPLVDFLTARWGMHTRVLGKTRFVPNEHGPWPIQRADLISLDDELLAAAGLPGIADRAPDSVLFSPGVITRFGMPVRDPAARD